MNTPWHNESVGQNCKGNLLVRKCYMWCVRVVERERELWRELVCWEGERALASCAWEWLRGRKSVCNVREWLRGRERVYETRWRILISLFFVRIWNSPNLVYLNALKNYDILITSKISYPNRLSYKKAF